MGIEITISPDGRIVIPEDALAALDLKPGERLMMERIGRRLVFEPQDSPSSSTPKISYAEFRRRVPKYEGPPVAIEDMTIDFGRLWSNDDKLP